jgi:hypothetical protein
LGDNVVQVIWDADPSKVTVEQISNLKRVGMRNIFLITSEISSLIHFDNINFNLNKTEEVPIHMIFPLPKSFIESVLLCFETLTSCAAHLIEDIPELSLNFTELLHEKDSSLSFCFFLLKVRHFFKIFESNI